MAEKYQFPTGHRALVEEINAGKILRYQLTTDHQLISFSAFVDALASDDEFRLGFNTLLSVAPFSGYRLETPAFCLANAHEPFEFVLIDAPELSRRSADVHTFSQYFDATEYAVANGIVKFNSLSGDATLIVPAPLGEHESYSHLASATRSAPESQLDSLWQVVGQELQHLLGAAPLWFNTEGSGVSWLHVRLDTRPKYYGFSQYKKLRVSNASGATL